jgi:hypothetical protein
MFSWADAVKNEEVLRRVKEERRILQTIKRRKSNWIGHILRKNCPVKHVVEGKREGAGIRGRRRKQLLDDRIETRRHWQWKEEALDRILEKSLWKRLWTCRKTDDVTTIEYLY